MAEPDRHAGAAVPGWGGGLLGSVQGLASTLLDIGHTRLALLAIEVEEEKRRLLAVLAWGAVALLLGCMALLFGALTLTVVFWENHRLLALGGVSALFALAAVGAVWQVKAWARPPEGGALAASLAELQADVAALSAAAKAAGRGAASHEGGP